MKKIILVAVLVGILAFIFAFFYFVPPFGDFRILSDQLDSVPKYSDDGKCSDKERNVFSYDFEYSPSISCSYISELGIKEFVRNYEEKLEPEGWECGGESLICSQDYGRYYYRDGFRLSIFMYTSLNQVRLGIERMDRGLYKECSDISLEPQDPVYSVDNSSWYTPPSKIVLSKD